MKKKRLLDRIKTPADLRLLSEEQLPSLAAEVRERIIDTVASTGGHLASSLGAVEIAIALHYALDTPTDRIIWDVGHQAYAHKILTGRGDAFKTLRQKGGISGFPKPSESEYDTFAAGHSSTSISAALGLAAARDLAGRSYKVVPVIGDGSLTAGLAFEGLNQAGHIGKDIVVILNDNEMSISANVGALSRFLSRKITGRLATRMKKEVESFISSVPRIGGRLMRIAKRAEDSLITLFTPGMLFEGLGFNYVGPIDGHDVSTIIRTLKDVEELKGPVLIHALTTKGKGFAPAEQDPALFHGIGKFDRATGAPEKSGKRSYTDVFSSALVELASKDRRVVAITAAMPEGTGLATFAKKFPDRFFDVGIAEQHAVTFAGGLAKEGFLPVTAIYSTFLQRAYDEVFHDVCLQGLPVIFALDRAGIVGADGPTHHGLFDIAYLRHLPGMVVTAPKDEAELRLLLLSSAKYGKPVSIRYPRGACLGVDMAGEPKDIPLGKGELIQCGKDVTIVALGTMVEPAMEAAKRLEKSGTDAGVVNARFVKPLDEELIIGEAVRTGKVLTVEEGALQGGFGSAVMELFEERGLNVMVKRLGAPDRFIEHGGQTELLSELGLDANGIEAAARALAGSNETKRKIAY